MPTYRERLSVPVTWWVLAGLAVLAVAAVLTVLPTVLLLLGSAITAAALGVGLTSYTMPVEVTDAGLRAGRALLPWSAMGEAEVLDAVSARALRGARADPRAYLALRGYVPLGVRVTVLDEADPTPYWYVSSRQPAALAAAIQRARPPRTTPA